MVKWFKHDGDGPILAKKNELLTRYEDTKGQGECAPPPPTEELPPVPADDENDNCSLLSDDDDSNFGSRFL